jgi:hypothetical protein
MKTFKIKNQNGDWLTCVAKTYRDVIRKYDLCSLAKLDVTCMELTGEQRAIVIANYHDIYGNQPPKKGQVIEVSSYIDDAAIWAI